VGSGGATGSEFRARTSALTLLWVATSADRGNLLTMLESSLEGDDALRAPDEGQIDYDEALEEEDEELDAHVPMQLTGKGEEMLFVSGAIERWLRRCPQGSLELGPAGARALAPMVLSWSATLTHALAPGPVSLAELQRVLAAALDPETVERRLEELVDSGQVKALHESGRAPRYTLTDWGREAISPIVAAVRYEQRYREEDVLDPDVFDVEAAFQMALPLIRVPAEARGTVRAGVRIPGEETDEAELIAGSTIEVEDGRVTASSALLERMPETWVTGTPLDWCETVIDPAEAKLEMGGDVALAQGLIEALHERLWPFGGVP
jgi:DNA-binding HxlR family transcriptional regulator